MLGTCLYAQSPNYHDVLGAEGGTVTVGNTIVWYTLGESLVATGIGTTIQVTEGFHQPNYELLEVSIDEPNPYEIKVFPTPAQNQVHVEFNRDENVEMQVDLVDVSGK
ncbi:MAG: hypothetical protein AAF570_05940, partial [Bacteroidota bacterium]